MKEFKARASSAGVLLTNHRLKSETMAETVKTYLQEWAKEQIYWVRKEIKSKYLEKGTVMEAEAIEKAIEWANLPFVVKNDEKFEDEFFTGTPDVIGDDFVVDTKCSWDCFSFPLFETDVPERNYYAQLQVYMHLTGKKHAKLIYVLLNTPEYITWEKPHDYSAIDPKYRVKVFEFDYDAELIAELQQRVINAREYINNQLTPFIQ